MSDAPARISLARLVLEVRRRTDSTHRLVNRTRVDEVLAALKRQAAKEKGTEGKVLREVLAAVLGIHQGKELEGRPLDELSPQTILQLDLVFDAMMDGRITTDELRDYLRECLIQSVK